MRRSRVSASLIVPMIGEAAIVAVVQFAPIALLTVGDYARYSGIYLIYAAMLTFQLATLSDVWARAVRRDALVLDDSHAYYSVLTPLTLLSIAVAVPVSAIASRALLPTVIATVATVLSLFRAGSRYYLIAAGFPGRAGIADALGALTGLALLLGLWASDAFTLTSALAVWALVNLVSLIASRATPALGFTAAVEWFSSQRRSVAALLGEAGIMNLASVGTPYAVGLVVGAPGLALHRGATSLAYPVRLVLGALRSRILAGLLRRGAATHVAIASLGLVLGGGVLGFLQVADDYVAADSSALSLVAKYAAPVAALVAATTYSTFLQFEARGTMTAAALLARRTAHTLLVLGITVSAAVVWGMGGMMWGAAVATAATSIVWVQRSTLASAPQHTLSEGR